MNPSPQAISTIQSQVSNWSVSNDIICSGLNSLLVNNPTTQSVVGIPWYASTIFGGLSTDSRKNIRLNTLAPDILKDINSGNPVAVGAWVEYLGSVSDITAAEGSGIFATIMATGLDPTYQSQLPWSVVNLGRTVDTNDIQVARP